MSRDGDYDWNNAHALLAARIAELESERDQAERERFRFGALNKGLSNRIAELEAAGIRASNEFSIALRDSRVRIAELEAERELTTPPMWRKAYDEQKIEIARLTAENARIAELEADLSLSDKNIAAASERIAELEGERDHLKALVRDQSKDLRDNEAERDRLKVALCDLEKAEADYRIKHDTLGDAHIDAGRAWDKLRKAGNRARAAFSREGVTL